MWQLIHEDTFGFGEDRDSPKIEKKGENDQDGFFQLWLNVLGESVSGTPVNPTKGFSRFTLVLCMNCEESKSIYIETDKFIKLLAVLKQDMNLYRIKEISDSHYMAFKNNKEKKIWDSFNIQRINVREL